MIGGRRNSIDTSASQTSCSMGNSIFQLIVMQDGGGVLSHRYLRIQCMVDRTRGVNDAHCSYAVNVFIILECYGQ